MHAAALILWRRLRPPREPPVRHDPRRLPRDERQAHDGHPQHADGLHSTHATNVTSITEGTCGSRRLKCGAGGLGQKTGAAKHSTQRQPRRRRQRANSGHCTDVAGGERVWQPHRSWGMDCPAQTPEAYLEVLQEDVPIYGALLPMLGLGELPPASPAASSMR